MKKNVPVCALIAAIMIMISPSASGAAPSSPLRPALSHSLRHDVSPKLREILPSTETVRAKTSEIPYFTLPKTLDAAQGTFRTSAPWTGDPVVQTTSGLSAMPLPFISFEGVGNRNGVLPPDTNGDVGPNHYVQWVNLSFEIWDKGGHSLYGPASGNVLWSGFGGACEESNHGDPIVLYDHLADRWLMSQFAFPNHPSGPFYQCIAVSATGDPTDAWYRYAFALSDTKLNDYPHFGVWPDGYYLTVNQFANMSAWGGAGVFVFDRANMLQGNPAGFVSFDLYSVHSGFSGMLASHLNGPAPAPGTPNYFVEVDDTGWMGDASDSLRIWEFHVDWTNPQNSTFGNHGQPNQIIPVADFVPLCMGLRSCITQPGTTYKLDAIGDRLMYRLQFRDFGSEKRMVVNHTVDAGSGRAGIRWYELRNSGSGWSVAQQGTYAPSDGLHRWMGSAAMDKDGNFALGYSVSGNSASPSIRYAGRLAGDPPNELTQGEAELVAGSGSQLSSSSRWGDYSSMSVDPIDGCSFWYTQEYIAQSGITPWQTRIGAFRFPSCTLNASGALTGTVLASGLPVRDATVSAGGFSTTTDGAGGYRFASLPVATYSVTASKHGYASGTAAGVVVSAVGNTAQNFSLSPLAQRVVSGTVTDGSGHGWPLYARIDISADGFGQTLLTDPVSGAYSITLYEGNTYHAAVRALSGGYIDQGRTFSLPQDSGTQDFSLLIDFSSCSAPGYRYVGPLDEAFGSGALPAGWSVIDNGNAGKVWRFDNTGSRSNYTGGAGGFAIVDSDFYGSGVQDTELRTPIMDFSGKPNVHLYFDTDFQYNAGELADVDVSTDGGALWTNVWRKGENYRGPHHEKVNLSSVAGDRASVMVRFRYYGGNWDWWWEVDNVSVGTTCGPVSGGLVAGTVFDANTGDVLSYANVAGSGTTVAVSPGGSDVGMPAGAYLLFLPEGPHTLTASQLLYGDETQNVQVSEGSATRRDFHLPAANLYSSPALLEASVIMGQVVSVPLVMHNAGGIDGEFSLLPAALAVALPVGPFEAPDYVVKPFKQAAATDAGLSLPAPPAAPPYAAGTVFGSWSTGLQKAWGIAASKEGTVWVGSPVPGWGGNGTLNEYTASGAATGRSYSFSWSPLYGPADGAVNWNTGMLWIMNVAMTQSQNCINEIDPSFGFTGNTLCPEGIGFTNSQRGLAYDPFYDTWFAGGWNDGMIHRFDSAGAMIEERSVGLTTAGLAYNPDTGHLFVSTRSPGQFYVLDVANAYAVIGSFTVNGFSQDGGAGLEIGCDGHLWAVDQSTQTVFEIDSGETTTICSYHNIPWLKSAAGTAPALGSTSAFISFDGTQIGQPGTYEARLLVRTDTPYRVDPIPVKMTASSPPGTSYLSAAVTPSGSGTVAGSGISCPPGCGNAYTIGTEMALTAEAKAGYIFSGWSGCNSASVDRCRVKLDGNKSVSAAFQSCANLPVRIQGGNAYASVMEAYTGYVMNADTLQCHATGFREAFEFSRSVSMTLRGGYDCGYASASQLTAIEGTVTIRSGSITFDRVVIQ